MGHALLTRRMQFDARHRFWHAEWTEAENSRVFGSAAGRPWRRAVILSAYCRGRRSIERDWPYARNANRPPDRTERGNGGSKNERAFIPGALHDNSSHDRTEDSGEITERVLHADPSSSGARASEHLSDCVQVERQ